MTMSVEVEARAVPMPVQPGREMEDLSRFHVDVTWTGEIEAEAMGPGTPAMTAIGSGTHERIQGGRWIVGSYRQDQYLPDGTFVLAWELHWVAGWDPSVREYRAVLADCYGHTGVMRGEIEGNRLVFETIGEGPVSLRLTWELLEA